MQPGDVRDPQPRTFEDFVVGQVARSRGRTIDQSDINLFAGLTGDFYPLHCDAEVAKTMRFGVRIAHGPLTFCMAIGLIGQSGFYGDAIVALIEIKWLRATKPVFAGDTLRATAEIIEVEPTGNPEYGRLGVRYTVLNQRGEDVMTFEQHMLARRTASDDDA